jgi:WhiB family redox-sensing transcriptional regulator
MNEFLPENYPDFEEFGDAPCTQTNPEAFFSEDPPEDKRGNSKSVYKYEYEAKKVCSDCPYQQRCLVYALANNETGIWGGTTDNERRQIRRSRLNPLTYRIRSRTGSGRSNKLGLL